MHVRVPLREGSVESGEGAAVTSRQADKAGVGGLPVSADRGQVRVDVGDRVGPELAPWMRADAGEDGGLDGVG